MSVIVSKANKALVIPAIPATQNVFADAPKFDNKLIVRHDVRNTLLLRHMGYNVPSPIRTHYDWPRPDDTHKPFHVQEMTCAMLTENPRAYVLNDKGTGKTRAALWAWDFLNQAGIAHRPLVVCPKSTLRFVWEAEAFALFPERKVSVLYGKRKTATREQRLAALAADADIYIINHDGLRVVADEIRARPDIDVLIIDELSVYRNPSDRFKLMANFAQRFKIVWGMTGSPMPQEPTDVWCQGKIITPATVTKRRKATKEMLMTQLGPYTWRPKPDAVEKAYTMLQPNVRYTLADVTELPDLVERVIDVPLSAQQEKVYKDVKNELVAIVKDKTVKAVNAGVALSKLTQISTGYVYTRNPEFVKLDADPRITQLIDDIQGADQKVLVFVPFRHTIEGIGKEFEGRKVPFKWCTIHGDTHDRDQIFHQFQSVVDPSDETYIKVMLADPRTIHHGVTLTSANTGIWYCPITSFEVYDQANARFRRYGQKHRQLLLHYQSTPVERRMYRQLEAKDTLQMKLLDMLAEATEARDAA